MYGSIGVDIVKGYGAVVGAGCDENRVGGREG